jgi:hypothetical protein
VNSDDMLLWWAEDGTTAAADLYVESLRRPRHSPGWRVGWHAAYQVLAVPSGSSEAGRVAAGRRRIPREPRHHESSAMRCWPSQE